MSGEPRAWHPRSRPASGRPPTTRPPACRRGASRAANFKECGSGSAQSGRHRGDQWRTAQEQQRRRAGQRGCETLRGGGLQPRTPPLARRPPTCQGRDDAGDGGWRGPARLHPTRWRQVRGEVHRRPSSFTVVHVASR
eukprot:scaffold3611_cov364-Prasinococcus_capsulatus_cf.AAC.2